MKHDTQPPDAIRRVNYYIIMIIYKSCTRQTSVFSTKVPAAVSDSKMHGREGHGLPV